MWVVAVNRRKNTRTLLLCELGVTSMSCVNAITSRAAVNAPPKPAAAAGAFESVKGSVVGGLKN